MKTKNFIRIYFLLLFGICYSQNNFVQIGSDGHDAVYDLVSDLEGNSYLTGFFQKKLNNLKAKGDSDAFIAKLNSNNDLIWMKSLGSDYKGRKIISEYGKFIVIDKEGNSYTVGLFYNNIKSDDGVVNVISKGKQDIFIAKYDKDGERLWIKSFGTVNNENIKGFYLKNENLFLISEFGIDKSFRSNRNVIFKINKEGVVLSKKNILYDNLLSFSILKIESNSKGFYFHIKSKKTDVITFLNNDLYQLKKVYTIENRNLISFDLDETYLYFLLKEEGSYNLLKKELSAQYLRINKKLNLPKTFKPLNLIIDSKRNLVIGHHKNKNGIETNIYDITKEKNLIKKYRSLRGENINIENGKLTISGRFYGNFLLDKDEIYSKGRTDGFIYSDFLYKKDKNIHEKKMFKIFPNPNNGEFKISNPQLIERFVLYDISGKEVYRQRIKIEKGNIINIKKSKLSIGIYNIRIYLFNGNTVNKKLIIGVK